MSSLRTKGIRGFGLIELTVVIIVIGVLTAIAMQSMTVVVDDVREAKTRHEMEMLSKAIVGDPAMVSGGRRSDFGYVGDIGAFPASLQALYANPGGYTTWKGPYIAPSFGPDSIGFKIDAWGQAYVYAGGISISSTGGGSTITKKIADAASDYLLNSFNGIVRDGNDSVPGSVYADSVEIQIAVPNGAGAIVTRTCGPDSSGAFSFDSLPVGMHAVRIIYAPDVDTLFRYITIFPRHLSGARPFIFASAYFAGGG